MILYVLLIQYKTPFRKELANISICFLLYNYFFKMCSNPSTAKGWCRSQEIPSDLQWFVNRKMLTFVYK